MHTQNVNLGVDCFENETQLVVRSNVQAFLDDVVGVLVTDQIKLIAISKLSH